VTGTATGTGRTGITRPVLLAGIVLGTCLTILAVWNGVRLRVPDITSILGAALGAVIVWALFMAVAAVLSELTVRHHRAVLRHGWRHGKRGGAAAVGWSRRTAQGAAVRSRPWRTRIVTAIRARWAARGAPAALEPEDPAGGNERICPGCGWAIPADGTCPTCNAGREAGQPDPGTGPTYSWGPADGPSGWPADDPGAAHRWAQHMSTDDGKPQVVTEYPPGGGPGRTIATYVNGEPVPSSTEGNTMTDTPDPAPPRGRRRVLTIGGTVPGEWKNLVAITADFEPEDDAELLAWMASEVNGMSAYAEALTEVYETGVSSVGLDPVSLAALHDTADAAADAAQAMATARQKFAAHYAEVREFAAAGGLLPHDGRWITGDGE
jgi:hypothetical protein